MCPRFALALALGLVGGSLAAQTSALTRTSGLGYDGAIVQSSPQSGDGSAVSWTPTENDVREAERLLPPYLDTPAALSRLRYTSIRSQLSRYKRQYWGTSDGNRRFIRIHFFHEETPIVQKGGWLKSAVSVMGGGDRYFRIKYELGRNGPDPIQWTGWLSQDSNRTS